RLVVIAAIDGAICRAATRIIRAPAPADVDSVIGRIGDVVVRDDGAGGISDEDRRLLAIIARDVADAVVADNNVANGHFRPGRMMRVRDNSTDHDRAAGEIAE